MKTKLLKDQSRILFLTSILIIFCFNGFAQNTLISDMDQLKWEKVMPGIWKASFGEMGLNPMDYTNPPNIKAIEELGDTPFPFDEEATYSLLTANRASIRLPLGETEKIYGLGLEFEGMNRRSNVYSLKVDHYGGTKGYTHAPVPFYISSKGYGVLINSSQRVKIHVGVGNRKDSNLPERIDRTTGKNWAARPLSDAIEASVQAGGMEIYVFTGQTNLEVVQRYNLFFGGGILPPKWGLGFWHRVHTTSSDQDVLKEIQDFESNNFPLDVIGLEPGWQSFAYPCSFDWDPTRFPNPGNFVNMLDKKGIKVNLWENPYVSPSSTMYEDIRPFTGSHTVWLGEVPDYTIPEAREVLLNHHEKNHLNLGVSGYKIDEVDGYDVWLWPDHATFPSGTDAVEMRQVYGMMMQDMFDDYFKKQNTRTYSLIRSAYIGASNHNFVLYSDYYDHKGYVTAMASASLTGLLWTPEIRSANSGEEWVRRFQTVAFSPLMMLNAWSSGKKPWSFPEVTDIVRNTIELRLKLLPYLYTAFYDYNQKGIPPFRAMILENGYRTQETQKSGVINDVTNPYAEEKRLEVTDQYMMGPSILVAPVFTGQKERNVVLPQGDWFDFYTGEYVGDGEIITIQTKLEEIPLFVKDGAIIPMLTSISKSETDNSLEVRHYGKKENSFLLYDDDGVSYNYEKGEFSMTELKAEKTENGKLSGSSNAINNKKSNYSEITWRWMTKQ
ncbi:glycoside hydrolase family 31 protein [Algoriphagus lutimaris]|uniref:TIM-barrel domain-containing protein n=1 Tax=Algoriphagus lutimaris TaxID=613197 RepID=UPI00196A5B17|nr:TIM-barrel domain-containing protein [Algoriphagus lutimaris]MBN3521067.1 glycoside hydrolase family 31 protein [Algoriphagus lutimaris]